MLRIDPIGIDGNSQLDSAKSEERFFLKATYDIKDITLLRLKQIITKKGGGGISGEPNGSDEEAGPLNN